MKSERFIIRKYEEADRQNFTALFTNEKVMKYVDRGVLTKKQAETFWKKLFDKLYPQNYRIWGVFDKANSRYVGHTGIYPGNEFSNEWEIVYFLQTDFWGRGYAAEIAERVIEFGFEELKLTEIFATVEEENPRSIRVLEKCGMKFRRFENDEKGRFAVYSITSNEREKI